MNTYVITVVDFNNEDFAVSHSKADSLRKAIEELNAGGSDVAQYFIVVDNEHDYLAEEAADEVDEETIILSRDEFPSASDGDDLMEAYLQDRFEKADLQINVLTISDDA